MYCLKRVVGGFLFLEYKNNNPNLVIRCIHIVNIYIFFLDDTDYLYQHQ